MKHATKQLASLVQSAVQSVSDHLAVPRHLDLTYITPRILALSECASAPHPTYRDDGRSELTYHRATAPILKSSSHQNSPADLNTFLLHKHPERAILINLSDQRPDDRLLLLLQRQIVQWSWTSPCKERSETPTLHSLLELCYIMHAYLSFRQDTVVLVSCKNGKTRTALVIACYLAYSGQVESTLDGFQLFCRKRCPALANPATHLPPSLQQLFTNFDDLLDYQTVFNPKPLMLRAIALQGVPVDDKPCMDLWDTQQGHLYSSDQDSQWADEEGFYRVNQVVEGDFCLLCRFGGLYASEKTADPSKVLFRYCHSTFFLASGIYELPKSKVDMMRRYEAFFEEDDFLLTLIFESYWDTATVASPKLKQDSALRFQVLLGQDAQERGWQLLTQHCLAQPSMTQDVVPCRRFFRDLQDCPDHILKLALQLTNLNLSKAHDLLMYGALHEWWANEELEEVSQPRALPIQHPIRPVTPETTCADILAILDEPSGNAESTIRYREDAGEQESQQSQSEKLSSQQPQDYQDDLIRYQPLLFPNRGDIVDAFGNYSKSLNTLMEDRFPPVQPLHPRLPMHKRKRGSVTGSQKKQRHGEERLAALKLLEHLHHTGVTLEDLLDLQRTAQRIAGSQYEEPKPVVEVPPEQAATGEKPKVAPIFRQESQASSNKEAEGEEKDEDVEGFEVAGDEAPGENDRVLGFAVREGHKISEYEEGEKGDTGGSDLPMNEDPEYEKYFKMLKMGLPIDVVKHALKRDGKDPSVMDLDHTKSVKSQRQPKSDGEVPLKQDPEYEKYFKMLKMGLPMDAVKHAMKRDEKDPTILDLDPEKSLKLQREGDEGDGPALKEDPEYEKYFKMLKMGLPLDAVKHSLKRDGKDPVIIDLDPEKSLKSQMNSNDDHGPPLKDDPAYEKYFKMLKMGLPMGAVKNALQRDGQDPGIMDLDPARSVKSQMGGGENEDDGPPLNEDPEFEKVSSVVFVSSMFLPYSNPKMQYFKMLKMGLPVGAVKNALQRDGKDPGIMDLDPEKSLKSQTGGGDNKEENDTGIPLKEDPEYSKVRRCFVKTLVIVIHR
jgi:hypothetical protein